MHIKPSRLFVIGFLAVFFTTALLYLYLPKVDFLSDARVVYPPKESLPQVFESQASLTNIDLLARFGTYMLVYWLFFAIAYPIAAKRRSLNDRSIRFHLVLSSLGFLFIILLNRHITLTFLIQPSYLSNVYTGGNLSVDQMMELEKEFIARDALVNFSSILGLLCLIIGAILFARNVSRSPKYETG